MVTLQLSSPLDAFQSHLVPWYQTIIVRGQFYVSVRPVPHIVVLAGPNGDGKSTAAADILRGTLAVDEFVNADVIARGLSEFRPESVAIEAGRVMLNRLRHLTSERRNVAFETTLASRTFAPWIRGLKADGYRFVLVFLCLPEPEIAIARVGGRVSLGGHFVPPEVIRRRHQGGLHNFFELYSPLADRWHFYNNAQKPRVLIADGTNPGSVKIFDQQFWDNACERSIHARSR